MTKTLKTVLKIREKCIFCSFQSPQLGHPVGFGKWGSQQEMRWKEESGIGVFISQLLLSEVSSALEALSI